MHSVGNCCNVCSVGGFSRLVWPIFASKLQADLPILHPSSGRTYLHTICACRAHKQGATHSHVSWDMRHFDGNGLRLSASEAVRAGEPLLSIPAHITMCHQTLIQQPHIGDVLRLLDDCSAGGTNPQCTALPGGILHKWTADTSNRLSLILGLYYEAFVSGEDSFWSPYLSTLPTKLGHLPGSFKPGSRAHTLAMTSSATSPAYQSQRLVMQDTVEVLLNLVSIFHERLGISIADNTNMKALRKQVQWAALIVFSREVTLNAAGLSSALVPLLDVIEFSVDQPATLRAFRQQKNNGAVQEATEVYVQVLASRDMETADLVR
jgi:hypothetical protein